MCVDGGQTLYGFGWETSLIEAGFLAIFVGNSTPRRGCSPLVEKLLRRDPRTVRLLAAKPFPDWAPNFVRALLYRYRYATPEDRRGTGVGA